MKSESDAPELSKTRRKRAMHELQALGERLVELKPAQLTALDLPERLADAVLEAKRIGGFEARRRQMQYIGRLMREVDAGPIAARIAALEQTASADGERHREAERWRERLIADESALPELVRTYPQADLQQLRTLARNARRERAQGRPPHAARALFRALRGLVAAEATANDAGTDA